MKRIDILGVFIYVDDWDDDDGRRASLSKARDDYQDYVRRLEESRNQPGFGYHATQEIYHATNVLRWLENQ